MENYVSNDNILNDEPQQLSFDSMVSYLAAAKRWITQYAPVYRDLGITILGDDLYCRQPICTLYWPKAFTSSSFANQIRTKHFMNGSKNSRQWMPLKLW